MLVSIVADFQNKQEREVDRYEAWIFSLLRLRESFNQNANLAIEQLESFLERLPQEQRSLALQDLIAEHLNLTWQTHAGEKLESYLEIYRSSYSELQAPHGVPASLVEDEFLARYQTEHGDHPRLEEYLQRFPDRKDIQATLKSRLLDHGQYVKLQVIGRGAMGTVWRAYDHRAQTTIAVKEAANSTSLKELQQETQITRSLHHANIITLKELPQDKLAAPAIYGMPYIVGNSLAREIDRHHNPAIPFSKADQRQSLNRLTQSMIEVSDALQHAHQQGILHRDIKPGNIILRESGQATIIDWGMAIRKTKETSNPKPAAIIAGTPEYMAPEQSNGTALAQSDVFALGSTLYQILSNQPPRNWQQTSPPANWIQQVEKQPIAPTKNLPPHTPRKLMRICMKALAHSIEQRYPSPKQFSLALKAYLDEQKTPWWHPLFHKFRRTPR
ncbi:MAG: serine/threonine protein kinase [Verrucomicrobiales bacterium]|nr:serine/threonine protein kinase [Verrucomicrobiales bacterium]